MNAASLIYLQSLAGPVCVEVAYGDSREYVETFESLVASSSNSHLSLNVEDAMKQAHGVEVDWMSHWHPKQQVPCQIELFDHHKIESHTPAGCSRKDVSLL